MEYPPSYCDGILYVNTFAGRRSRSTPRRGRSAGAARRWPEASTPAIAGTAPDRQLARRHRDRTRPRDGRHALAGADARARSSRHPSSSTGIVLLRLDRRTPLRGRVATGRVRWAYDTGGRINSSPSDLRASASASRRTPAPSSASRKDTGAKLWTTYVKRDAFRNESFYASPSTDGDALYTVARSGKVVALDARTGASLWTGQVGGLGYTTPAIAHGRVFVGGFDGAARLPRHDGHELWRAARGGPHPRRAVVIGNLVFFSTLEKRTFAARVSDGEIVWRLRWASTRR